MTDRVGDGAVVWYVAYPLFQLGRASAREYTSRMYSTRKQRESIPRITQHMLTTSLRELEGRDLGLTPWGDPVVMLV